MAKNRQNVHLTGALGNLLKTGQISSINDAPAPKRSEKKANNRFSTENASNQSFVLKEINPHRIRRWAEKDRPENELGNIEELAKSFNQVGQQVPCIVRPIEDEDHAYELIAGERRWEAAKLAKTDLQVIVQAMDDHKASLIQAVENEKRTDLSDYAKGISYARKIAKGLLTQKDLTDILGISKQQVSRLLSFNRIPNELISAIGDLRKVSARTAVEISRLSAKSPEHIDAIKKLAPQIALGKLGANKIQSGVSKLLAPPIKKDLSNQKVMDTDGRHLFTWRLDNNSVPSIHFPLDIADLLKNESISSNQLTQNIKEYLSEKLTHLKS